MRIAFLILAVLFISTTTRAEMFYWVDDQGVRNYATSRESIPEQYRQKARVLLLPSAPQSSREADAASSQKRAVRIPFAPGSPVLVNVRINGKGPITLILDTGADRTMIIPSVLPKLGLTVDNGQIAILKGVTGMSQASGILVDSVDVDAAKVGPLMIIVHDSDLRGADGLLGRDFLSGFNVNIDAKDGIVTLSPN
jgi:hypothetical protein